MKVCEMTDRELSIRCAVRAFLMTATMDELRRELQISLDMGNSFRADCVREMIEESDGEDMADRPCWS